MAATYFNDAVMQCSAMGMPEAAEPEHEALRSEDGAEEEEFCIFKFFQDYVERKMCVYKMLGMAARCGQPNPANIQEFMSMTRMASVFADGHVLKVNS